MVVKKQGNQKTSVEKDAVSVSQVSVDDKLRRKFWILLGSTIILLISLTVVLGRGQSIPSYIIESKIKKAIDEQFVLLDNNIKKQLEKSCDSTVFLLNVGYYKQDTCLENEIKYLVSKSSQEALSQYIEEENIRLTWLGIIITALVTLIGIGFPLYIRDKSEKRFEEITKGNEQRIAKATQQSSETIDEIAKDVVFDLDSRIESIDNKKKEMDDLVRGIQSAKEEQSSIISEMNSIKTESQQTNKEIKDSYNNVNKLLGLILEFTYFEKEKGKKDDIVTQILVGIMDNPYFDELINKFEQQFLQDGNISRETEKYQNAIKCYTNYVSIKKRSIDPIVYYNRGSRYYSLNDYKKAIEDFTYAIDDLGMNTKEVYNYRGSAYFKDEQYPKAIEDYNHSILLDSNYEDAYINLAATYKAMENYQMALHNYEKAIEIKTHRTNSDNIRKAEEVVSIVKQPDLLKQARNEDEPNRKIELYNVLIKDNPSIALLHYELGMAYLDINNMNGAIDSINSAISNDTNNNEYKLYLQLLQHLCNIKKNAEKDKVMAIKEAFEGVSKSPNLTWFKYFEPWINTLVSSTESIDN